MWSVHKMSRNELRFRIPFEYESLIWYPFMSWIERVMSKCVFRLVIGSVFPLRLALDGAFFCVRDGVVMELCTV